MIDQGTDARIDPRRFSADSIFKSLVTHSLAEDSANARRGNGDKVSDALELKLQRD